MMNHTLIQYLLIACGFCTAVMMGILLPENPEIIIVLLATILAVALIHHHGSLAVILLTSTISSAFILPHASRPYVWEVSSIFAFSGVFSAIAFRAWPNYSQLFLKRNSLIVFSTIAYGFMLIPLMHHHGAGLRILGSEAMGARFYLQQAILIPLPLCAILFPLSRSLATKLLIVQLILAFSYVISESFFRFQLPGASLVLQFVELQTDTMNFTLQEMRGGITRYQSIGVFSYNVAILLLVVYPMRRVFTARGAWIIPIFAALVLLSGIGGSRRLVLKFLVISASIFWIQRALDVRRLCAVILIGMLSIAVLYQNTEHLPLSIQRTISFLPGIEVDSIAQADANTTMSLRRELRWEALRLIKLNFWTGVGFDVDPNLRLINNPAIGAFERHALNGRFYSGPIGIFATLGVGHFALFTLMQIGMLTLAIRLTKMLRASQDLDLFERITALIVARYFAVLLIYIFITGDASNALKSFVPHAVMMIICERILYLKDRAPPTPAEPDAPPLNQLT